jgi:hypothetical protein
MTTGLRIGLGGATIILALGLAAAARADAAIDDGLAPDPRLAARAYLAKGQLNLMLGKAGAAAADLEQAVRLKPGDAYNALWLHFARNKEGAPDSVELQINAARANRAAWPGPLLDYMTGRIDAAAVLAAAEVQGKAQAGRLCEADLFLGQDDLAKGRRSQGLERLQAAARDCGGATREARLALADLEGPDASRPVLTPASSPSPKAPPALAEPALKPASVRPQVQARTLVGDPLLLRGSLK